MMGQVTNADSTNKPGTSLSALWIPHATLLTVYLGVTVFASAQTETTARPKAASRTANSATADLYRQLGSVSLDPAAVYKVRDASIDREDIHISLNDGTIAFTRAVNGHITGALFSGEGEILIVPPDFTERHSLSLFTKIAVLSERFSLTYLRFADDSLVAQLKPYLRPPEDAVEFLAKNDALALSLSEADALRTFIGLTYAPQSKPGDYTGEFLYARVSGEKLGGFDVVYDPLSAEQISVRQLSFTPRGRFYDLWMSFPMQSVRKQRQANAGDPVTQSVDITDYKIQMDVRPPTDLSGSATLTIKAKQSGARALLFELSRYLKLSSVELELPGRPATNLDFIQNEAIEGSQLSRRGNDTVTVVFPQPIAMGQTLQVKFTYGGSVMSEAGGGLLYVGARGTWYPNRGPAMSNYDLQFRQPAEWKLLATGKKTGAETKNGFTESRFISERPVPLAGFNLGKYVSTPVETAATQLEVYSARAMESAFSSSVTPQVPPLPRPGHPPPLPSTPPLPLDPSQNAAKVGRNAAHMIDFLAPRIGAFPYATLSITQLPGPNSQGWPGLIFLSSYAFLNKDERELSRYGAHLEAYDAIFDHLMVEHEIAHQWWGDNVFWDSYRDQWLMEALSNYCALQRLEGENPAIFHKILDQYRKELLDPPTAGDDRPYKEAGPVRLGLRLNSSHFAEGYTPVTYGRGSWLIHMLRELLRDAAPPAAKTKVKIASPATQDPDALFFSALKDIQTRYAGKKLTTALFLQAFEKVLPPAASFEQRRSLDWFYDGWINGNAIPALKLDRVHLAPAAGHLTASGVIVQEDAPELLVTPVPIYASVGDEAPVFVGRIFADGERTDFRLNVPAGTKKLLLDPYFAVLRKP